MPILILTLKINRLTVSKAQKSTFLLTRVRFPPSPPNKKQSIFLFFFKILKNYKVNNQIKADEVRVIDEEGKNLEVMKLEEALALAQSKNLDLVEITSSVNPIVVKICNYGKFLYQQEKEAKKQKIKERGDELKHIRLGFNIGKHDMEIRARQATEFLKEGLRVQVELVLKGREKSHKELAENKLKEFLTYIDHSYKIIQDIKFAPRGLIITIAP